MKRKKKTALVLGGGGARGAYEVGVWQALRELGVRIDIVCGTSVGAINGAMVAQNKFELAARLWQEIDAEKIFEILPELLSKYIDEDTLRRSPVEYGLATVELPATVHYLYKEDIPYGQIADYILASSSLAPAAEPHEIDGAKYIDGGFADVVPLELALNKGATDIIAVNLRAPGLLRKDKFKKAESIADRLMTISCAWDLGNVLVFDTDKARRLMRLGYLDGMKAFHVFSGNFYTFPHRAFDQKTLRAADAAARILELDPTLIYTRESLADALRENVQAHRRVMKREPALPNLFPSANAISLPDAASLPGDIRRLKSYATDTLSLLLKKVSRKTLLLYLAEALKNEPENQFLSSRTVQKLLREDLSAARYLVQNELV